MNILLLANELRYTCGVTNHLIHLSIGLSKIRGNRLWIICGGGNGIERFKDINVKIISDKRFLHLDRNLRSYASAIAFLAKILIKNKINIVHSHSHYAANIARNASRFTGTVTIQTNHGLLKDKGRLKHFNANRYIAINEHIYEYIIENNIAQKSMVSFIRCGIPVPASIPEKEKSKLKILAASRFIREKGLDTYIRAVSKLSFKTKRNVEFYIAGEGELKKSLQKINSDAGAGIVFLGSVKDMYNLLVSCHILVYPSRSKSEGFPAIITEAGANGLLVISSGFPGYDSVINDKQDGIIFKMDDVNDLSKKLSTAITEFERYNAISKKLYNKTKLWFSLSKMIIKHQELYRKCLS